MKVRNITPIFATMCSLLGMSQAHAGEMIFTGKISSGVDNGAIFAPVGTDLTGQKVSVVFDYSPVAPGTTTDAQFVGSTVTVLGHSFDSSDNDHPTGVGVEFDPTADVFGTSQSFDLGFSDTFAEVKSANPFVPAGDDLNSVLSYQVQPGDMASGFFHLANTSPGPGFTGPPQGGPGSSTPWSDVLAFSVDAVYVNTPAVVPEPATWVLMLTGFAGLGLMMRSRQPRPATMT